MSPWQVDTAVAAGLVEASLLVCLERAGAVGLERRRVVEALVGHSPVLRLTAALRWRPRRARRLARTKEEERDDLELRPREHGPPVD